MLSLRNATVIMLAASFSLLTLSPLRLANGFVVVGNARRSPFGSVVLGDVPLVTPLFHSHDDTIDHDSGALSSLVSSSTRQTTTSPGAVTRRQAATQAAASLSGLVAMTTGHHAAHAAVEPVKFSASWRAVDGLNANTDGNFVSFETSAYQAMRDDKTRTPLFAQAIEARLGSNPESQVVLDLGTGPFALFAILAAEKGAGKVYAIEANPAAAKSARDFVQKSGFADVITIVEGFSTKVELPEQVDFCIAEIVGSVASEEGAYATIRNAHRFLKQPTRRDSWIPNRIQTYAAPASYTLHNVLQPPEFDWTKLNGQPVRFNCRDRGLELLADPVLIEDISFPDILTAEQDARNAKKQITFVLDPERIEDNTLALYDEFRRNVRTPVRESELYAYQTGHSMTGIACWPRLILSDDIVVNARSYPAGDHQKSHWQTVLPIMAARPMGDLKGQEKVTVSIDFTFPKDVTVPPSYRMEGFIQQG